MSTFDKQRMFMKQHYNAIAKDIREEFPIDLALGDTQRDNLVARTVLCNLALRFARRFEADNPDGFDPLQFLDACSPDTDLYPLSELWSE